MRARGFFDGRVFYPRPSHVPFRPLQIHSVETKLSQAKKTMRRIAIGLDSINEKRRAIGWRKDQE